MKQKAPFPFTQMRNQRLREVKVFAQGRTVNRWYRAIPAQVFLTSEALLGTRSSAGPLFSNMRVPSGVGRRRLLALCFFPFSYELPRTKKQMLSVWTRTWCALELTSLLWGELNLKPPRPLFSPPLQPMECPSPQTLMPSCCHPGVPWSPLKLLFPKESVSL